METNLFKYLRTLSFSLTVAAVMGIHLPVLAQVSPQRTSQGIERNPEVLVAGLRFRVPNIRAPRNRAAGASRGGCSSEIQRPVALLPSSQIGLTVAANPTFFFHVPQATTKTAEFSLQDPDEQVVYERAVDLSAAPGIVSVSLPRESLNSPSLEVGKMYKWNFAVICDPTDRGQDIVLEGWIQRNELTAALANELEKAAPKDRPSIYANAGLWHDTVTSLVQLREANPNDPQLAEDWAALLQSIGLDAIAQSPLVSSVKSLRN
ncbi:MAG: DUF928 domain-containing protein [Microcoleus sp. SIO2G3]|nr:DUF928 domain-containing protein [Microcoleus sp. SIO2G3]